MRRTGILLAALVATTAWAGGDAPEISRSVGKKGGVVVLWPRVAPDAPAGTDAHAAAVQAKLAELARAATEVVDVRPAPERVCPMETGCKAVAVGAVVTRRGEGCAVVATVSAPGRSPQGLVPWAGELKLKMTAAEFRVPPEPQIVVTDFLPCAELAAALDAGAPAITAALAKALEAGG